MLKNSLAMRNPELLKEWDYEKNEELGLFPDKITYGSDKRAYWRCERNHTWDARINNRSMGRGCPDCYKQNNYLGKELSIAFPSLLNEWDYNKNGKLKLYPNKISIGSSKIAHWVCKDGHEWKTKIVHRANGSNCPHCYNESLLSNNVENSRPLLLPEWNFAKNSKLKIYPDKVSIGSGKKVYWVCKEGHEWRAQVRHRSNGSGCPQCVDGNSAIEKEIISRLNLAPKNITTKYEWYLNGKIAQCDGVDENNRIVIEYDGSYWHKDRIDTDVNKTKALIDTGYTVIRIREKGLKPLHKLVNSEHYYEINNIYPYRSKKENEIENIVATVNNIIEDLTTDNMIIAA